MKLEAIEAEKLRVGALLRKTAQPELAEVYEKCYPVTAQTTVETASKDDTFLITGDIPAMWLRDSAAQVRHYLPLASRDGETADFIEGLLHRQFRCISHDPYANAFNREPNGHCCCKEDNCDDPLIWERKYEVDSLCAPLALAYEFWKATGRTSAFDGEFCAAAERILDVWELEQHHDERSQYVFIRPGTAAQDTMAQKGKGRPTGYTGMTWSGFRPSDDSCHYNYLVPSNMYAVSCLGYLSEIARAIGNETLADRAARLKAEIRRGIEKYGTVIHEQFGKMYVYETDGLGNILCQDDANVPSLLSIPYLGYCSPESELYENTRRFVLSKENSFFFSGRMATGIGSPHTPAGYIWPIALTMQGLTATSAEEKRRLLGVLASTHAGTMLMHEGFCADNPAEYTRPWFAWACSLFCEFVQKCLEDGTL